MPTRLMQVPASQPKCCALSALRACQAEVEGGVVLGVVRVPEAHAPRHARAALRAGAEALGQRALGAVGSGPCRQKAWRLLLFGRFGRLAGGAAPSPTQREFGQSG